MVAQPSHLALRQFIAGSGQRHLHFVDWDHRIRDDNAVFYNADVIAAMHAGGFRNVVIENGLSQNNPETRSETSGHIAAGFAQRGLEVYFPDPRQDAIDALFANGQPLHRYADLYERDDELFTGIAQTLPTGTLNPSQLESRIRAYFRAHPEYNRAPYITTKREWWGGTTKHIDETLMSALSASALPIRDIIRSRELNAEINTNIEERFGDSESGTLYFYGAAHIDGSLGAGTDMDVAFPGDKIAVISNLPDGENQRNAEIRRRLRGADVDFVYDPTTPDLIHDIRPVNQRTNPTLRQILDRGHDALTRPQTAPTPVAPATPEPEEVEVAVAPQTPPSTEAALAPDAEAHDETTTDAAPTPRGRSQGFDFRNLPLGGIIGTLLGGWLFSGIDRGGFFNIIAMAFGALLGGFLGSRFGGGNREERETSNAEPSTANSLAAVNAADVVVAREPSLAFANVNSVEAPLRFNVENVTNGTPVTALPVGTAPISSDVFAGLYQ